jgi:peptidoglycan/LPS O-acetylase OafA/YrhL
MPQLDGLRAFAVAAVAISHWTPNFLVGIVPWGTGVQLFFVLSGFLITGILLRSRPVDLGVSTKAALKVFYTRRVLRIFPLYYGVLAICLLLAVGPIYSTWPWHVSYLSNIHYALHGHGDAIADPFLHFWSLSVEEQFYLLWPLIALVASRRALLIFLYSCIIGSVAFRVGVAHLAPGIASIRYLTPSCLDALAVGGLIAHAKHYNDIPGMRRTALGLACVGVAGLVVSMVVLGRVIGSADAHRIGHTFLVIFYGFIVAHAAIGFGGLPGRLLSLRPVLYLGRISYGLYVYHYFAPAAIAAIAQHTGLEAALQEPAMALPAYVLFTVSVSSLSWHLYEFPISKLKRYFEYPRTPEPLPTLETQLSSSVSKV